MTTLTIEIPEQSTKELTKLVQHLGGKVVSDSNLKKVPSAKKKQILDDLEESVAFVKQHQQGKVEARTIEQLLDEL